MRRQKSEVRNQKLNFKKLVIVFLLFTIHCPLFTIVFASEKWQGVDEAVVEKFAKEHGREANGPLINTEQGDLKLFVFLIAGAVGGFAAGYSWRVLIAKRPPKINREEQKIS